MTASPMWQVFGRRRLKFLWIRFMRFISYMVVNKKKRGSYMVKKHTLKLKNIIMFLITQLQVLSLPELDNFFFKAFFN